MSPPDFHRTGYGWMMLAGILVSIALWSRLARRNDKLMIVYIGALAGAFIGAKIVYLAAEGWLHWNDPNRWVILATGKSITGALIGGYAAVEITKRLVGQTAPTGDWFAIIVPTGVMLGRVGCMIQGCCLGAVCGDAWYAVKDTTGAPRWPAPEVELLFNAVALAVIWFLRRNRILPGQLFHLYLMAYGVFRFSHEYLRDTPRIAGAFSGYQIAALAVAGLGAAGFIMRRRSPQIKSDALLMP